MCLRRTHFTQSSPTHWLLSIRLRLLRLVPPRSETPHLQESPASRRRAVTDPESHRSLTTACCPGREQWEKKWETWEKSNEKHGLCTDDSVLDITYSVLDLVLSSLHCWMDIMDHIVGPHPTSKAFQETVALTSYHTHYGTAYARNPCLKAIAVHHFFPKLHWPLRVEEQVITT